LSEELPPPPPPAQLQPQVALPLIDSAQAGLHLLLQGQAPVPARRSDGFVADWCAMPPAITQLGPAAPQPVVVQGGSAPAAGAPS
jgi:hypothetical protein